MTKATLIQARQWLLKLAAPHASNVPEATITVIVSDMAEGMVASYTAQDFTTASRHAVSAGLKWFREADIRELLDAWIVAQKRPVTFLPTPLLRPSDHVLETMLRQCQGTPGPWLAAWLEARGVYPPYPEATPRVAAPVVSLFEDLI